jgi:hypothetical protein
LTKFKTALCDIKRAAATSVASFPCSCNNAQDKILVLVETTLQPTKDIAETQN